MGARSEGETGAVIILVILRGKGADYLALATKRKALA